MENYYLDITNEVCPITFVKTKLLIERMPAGEIAEVRLKRGEPLDNVPRSLEELGHTVIELKAEDENESTAEIFRLRVRKAG